MKVISVVRNFSMYEKLVKNNMYYTNADFIAIDNNIENKYITVRYNEFLDGYDYTSPSWLIFCHEDWELKEPLEDKLRSLDKDTLYGPIGCVLNFDIIIKKQHQGQIQHSDKNGDNIETVGHYVHDATEVGTFDCQCLIVHSDVIKKYSLRFDEKLSYDLYVEDFCINARESLGVKSKVLQLKCLHWSKGKIEPRFEEQFKYLQNKYIKARNAYFVTCSASSIGSTKYDFMIRVKGVLLKCIHKIWCARKK